MFFCLNVAFMSKGTLDDQVELALSRFDNDEEDDLQVFGERRDSEEDDTIRKYDDDESDKPFMSKYKKLWYATIIARYPILSLLFFAAIPIVLTGIAATYPVQIDYSLSSFRARGHEVIIQIEAFKASQNDYYHFLITWWDVIQRYLPSSSAKRSTDSMDSLPDFLDGFAHPGWQLDSMSHIDNINFSMPLDYKYTTKDGLPFGLRITQDFQQGSQVLRTTQSRDSAWSVHIVFFAPKKGGNIITPEYIEKMNEIKKKVEAIEGYTDFCTTTFYRGILQCEEPQSLLPFFYPSHDPTTGVGIPDGKGDNQADLIEALTAVFRQGIYHFTDERFKPASPISEYFRIQFRFGRPVKGFVNSEQKQEEQWQKFREFINSKLSFFKSLDSQEMPIMFGGNSLTDHEILQTVWGDATLAVASLSVVFLLMYVSMGSFFPSFMGMLMICFSFPTVYFIFRVILQVDHIGVLNVLALFVIIGVGVDDLFVFFNMFQHYENINDVELRLAQTIRHAAKATFITSFTTAASFGINAVSTIPALRFFGIFMGLLVMLNYFMAISWYPAVLVIWEKHWKKRLETFDPMRKLWNSVSNRVAYKPMKYTSTQLTSFEVSSEDSDSDESGQGFNYAERFFRFKFAPMIEKRRVIIIVVFALVIGASIFSITQLRTSDHVPTLFPSTSNLQRFLNWELNGLFYSTGAAISLDPNLKYGCDGVLNSGATKDICGVCAGNCDTCRDCTGKFPRSCEAFKRLDSCGVCGGNGTSCTSCDGVPGSNKRFDACGVCGGTNSTCAGCDWIPWSNKTRDACGICGGDGSSCAGCDGVPKSGKVLDACGVCGGDGTSCAGCDGVPNSGKKYDTCGVCGGDGSSCTNPPVQQTPTPVRPPTPVSPPVNAPLAPRPPVAAPVSTPVSNPTPPVAAPTSSCTKGYDPCGVCGGNGTSCAGCDGVPYSGKTRDACGVCGGDGSSCAGCDGVPNSGKKLDKCGVCGGNDNCLGCDGVKNSNKTRDLCGVCDGNNACLGCDGVPNSGKKLDDCGVCGGNGRTCLGCDGVRYSNKTVDGCGVCGGDNTTCGGCDHVPFSTTKFDQCGVCGGNNECYKNQVNFEEIDVVFGIRGFDATGFDPNNIFQEKAGNVIYDTDFDVADPEVQRALLSACILISNNSELVQPGKTRCYMQGFKEWLSKKKMSFPVLNKGNFYLMTAQFIGTMSRQDQSWLWDVGFDLVNNRTDKLTIKWVRYHFQTTIVKGRTSFDNYNEFLKWNELIAQVNQLSPKAQAFHTTHAWDIMITEVVAVSGIKWGLIISAIVALGSILVFTGNLVVSILAIVSVLGNIAVMLGCFWVFGWSLGVVEALSITVLVGLSVDYCIHVAETYNLKYSESRSNKLRHALTSMGLSVVSGAVTTMGAVFILLFCTVQIFVTFGVIIAVNSFLSVVFTLFFFSALLSFMGPVRHQGSFYALLCCLVCRKRRQRVEAPEMQSMEELWFDLIDYSKFTLYFTRPETLPEIVKRFSTYTKLIGLEFKKSIRLGEKFFIDQILSLSNLTSLKAGPEVEEDSNMNNWSPLTKYTNLTHIDVIAPLPASIVKHISNPGTLDNDDDFITALEANTNIEYLTLYSILPPDKAVIKPLDLLPNPSRLTRLTLETLNDEHNLERFTNMKRLHIRDYVEGHEGVAQEVRQIFAHPIKYSKVPSLERLKIDMIRPDPDIHKNVNLTSLKIKRAKVTEDYFRSIGTLTKLQFLSIELDHEMPFSTDWLSLLTLLKLEHLILTATGTGEGFKKMTVDVAKFNRLDLRHDYGFNFSNITHLTGLQHIELIENEDEAGAYGPNYYDLLENFSQLTRLSVMSGAPLFRKFTLKGLKNLKALVLDAYDVVEDEVRELTNLESLEFCGQIDIEVLEAVGQLTNLTQLQFEPSPNTVNHSVLTKLSLKKLYLAPGYPVSDDWIETITQITTLENLSVWDLFEDENVNVLSVLSNLTELRGLRLESCKNLLSLTNLQMLQLAPCNSATGREIEDSIKSLTRLWDLRIEAIDDEDEEFGDEDDIVPEMD